MNAVGFHLSDAFSRLEFLYHKSRVMELADSDRRASYQLAVPEGGLQRPLDDREYYC